MPFFDYQANILPNFDIFKRPQFHSTPKYNIIIWVSQELKWFSNRKLRENHTEFCILAAKCIQKCHFWRFGLILSQIGQMHRSSYLLWKILFMLKKYPHANICKVPPVYQENVTYQNLGSKNVGNRVRGRLLCFLLFKRQKTIEKQRKYSFLNFWTI